MQDIQANWSAPPQISALTTTRLGGFSEAAYASNNLGLHVQDNPAAVQANRQALRERYQLPAEPLWLTQVHGTRCILAESDGNREADAMVSRSTGQPLAILTADCLPIALCNTVGTEIALIHAGWRGLVDGIIGNTLACMQSRPDQLIAWLGPAICGNCFEVGEEVYNKCIKSYHYVQNEFIKTPKNTWVANLPGIATKILEKAGLSAVSATSHCTMEESEHFYSYRKASQTGRMATLIWINKTGIKT